MTRSALNRTAYIAWAQAECDKQDLRMREIKEAQEAFHGAVSLAIQQRIALMPSLWDLINRSGG